MSKPNYAQISSLSDIVNPGVYITGSGLFVEPATLLDKNLSGGIYIVDSSYRPIIALDDK